MKKITFLFFYSISLSLFANDGAYYASGNQLIPISENEVSITKEILTINRKLDNGTEYIYVTVDYTFFNPSFEKTILVGFEADYPSGDAANQAYGFPKNGEHPYISNFKVMMNGSSLQFESAMVNSEKYYIENKIDAKTEAEVNGNEFYYVYYFDALFKPGVNKIIHTYSFYMSSSIEADYCFDYILTAANRWSNNQVDDFILNIDMGPNEGFNIENTFFNSANEWLIDSGRIMDNSTFITYNGKVTFKKKNFHPKGELHLQSIDGPLTSALGESFDIGRHNLPKVFISPVVVFFNKPSFVHMNFEYPGTNSVDEDSFKVLRNFPFAIRGYVFNNKLIQNYYLLQSWYKPDPGYKPDLEKLSKEEREWLKIVKLKEWDK